MKEIHLTRGYVALVDDEDYERLNQHKWFTQKAGSSFYAGRNSPTVNGKRKMILMHREAIGLTDNKVLCDHINRNGLDNRKANLRACTSSENCRNTRLYSNSTSGKRGVSFRKDVKKFIAYIKIDKRQSFLGYFNTAEDAAKAYDEAAKIHYGEFATLNFP